MEGLKKQLPDDDIVMAHYVASPFASSRIITDTISIHKEKGVSASCTNCYQLMGSRDSEEESRSWVDRDKYIQIAYPLYYKFGYLMKICQRAVKEGILESTAPHTTSLAYKFEETVYQSYGDQTNIKITTMEDISLFERWIKGSGR